MYLSDRELRAAIESGRLILDPPPETIDPTSIDLHLDRVEEAQVWDIDKFTEDRKDSGHNRPEVRIGTFRYASFAEHYLRPPAEYDENTADLVQRRLRQVIVRPGGFLLWQTKEVVGTPQENAAPATAAVHHRAKHHVAKHSAAKMTAKPAAPMADHL